MAIDPDVALGATLAPYTTSWDADAVILYHLGVGAGFQRPTDPAELAYTYERDLVVLPSFAVVPPFPALVATMVKGELPGVTFNPSLILHGERDLEIHRSLPSRATVEHRGRIASLYDKGKAAVFTVEVDTGEAGGEVWYTNRFTFFARGEGGFTKPGTVPVPVLAPANAAPDRAPDVIVESPTLPHQAFIYRLAAGERTPLHVDPKVALEGGFDRPTLHGLCTYGIICKAVVDTLLDGDVSAVARYSGRFTGVMFPGETIVTSMWREGERIILTAAARERAEPVLANAAIWIRSSTPRGQADSDNPAMSTGRR